MSAEITLLNPAATAPTGLDQLSGTLRGTLAAPGQPGYERAASWNTAITMHPLAVVTVADAADIAHTVRFAAEHGLRVAVQCTGHGAVQAAGNDVLLVDTSALTKLEIDPSSRRARIGAGLTWRPVIEDAAAYGLAPVAGSAIDVGVVGFLTGGGIGPLVRHFGLASDWVTAFEVITGDGEILHVDSKDHAELFWGLRGGKSTLGIVCAVEVQLVSCARFFGGALYYDTHDIERVTRTWARTARELPESIDTSLALIQLPAVPAVPAPLAGRMTVAVRCASTAGAGACEPLLAPLRAVATPLIDTLADRPYAELGAVHADPTEPTPVAMHSVLLHELPQTAVDALLVAAGPVSGSPQTMCELRRLGGAYARSGAAPSAFCHRDVGFNLAVIGRDTPQDGAHVAAHAQAVLTAISPWASGGAQPNFSAAAGPQAARRCYDATTLVRLSALGDRYDPSGVLAFGQAVRGF